MQIASVEKDDELFCDPVTGAKAKLAQVRIDTGINWDT